MTNTAKRNNILLLVPLVVAALASSGCGGRQEWKCVFTVQKDKAVIDMDRVTLIFEGIAAHRPKGQTGGGGGTCSLVVAGSGKSKVTLKAFGKSFINSYSNGVNTMTFDGHTLQLLDSGTKLQIGTQEFDLTGKKKTIVIHKDGRAEAQEPD